MAQGQKTGGRRKGTPNKAKAAVKKQIDASGLMPLDYMLQVLRNEKEDAGRRAWAAKEAAPYLHAKLTSVEVGNKGGEPFKVLLGAADPGLL